MNYYWIAAIVFAVVTSLVASSKDRSTVGWFIVGLLIGPFALIVAILPPLTNGKAFVRCPACAEVIRADAGVCRHCGGRVESQPGCAS